MLDWISTQILRIAFMNIVLVDKDSQKTSNNFYP